MRGLKVWKQNGIQILSIEKTQVLTMHAWIEQLLHNSGISWKQNGVQIIGWRYSLYTLLKSKGH